MSGSSRYLAIIRSSILSGLTRPSADEARDLLDRVGDLGPAAVVDAHRQLQHVVVAGLLLRDLQLPDHAAPQPRPPPRPPDPHAHLVHLVDPAADDVPVEAHQEAHLVGAALPVLGGERVRREPPHPDVDAAAGDVHQRRLARRWPSIRGRPRALAQRPLPSITSATWLGTSSRGIAGGRAPEGCGGGGWGTGDSYELHETAPAPLPVFVHSGHNGDHDPQRA